MRPTQPPPEEVAGPSAAQAAKGSCGEARGLDDAKANCTKLLQDSLRRGRSHLQSRVLLHERTALPTDGGGVRQGGWLLRLRNALGARRRTSETGRQREETSTDRAVPAHRQRLLSYIAIRASCELSPARLPTSKP